MHVFISNFEALQFSIVIKWHREIIKHSCDHVVLKLVRCPGEGSIIYW